MLLLPQKSVLLALAIIAITGAAASDCFNLDGFPADLSFTLNNSSAASLRACNPGGTCCFNDEEACNSNLLCKNKKSNTFSRQYCSDREWPDGRCSKLCSNKKDAGVQLTQCGDSERKFCCPDDGPDCCEKGEYWEINDEGVIIAHGNETITPTSSPTSSPTLPPTSPPTANVKSETTKLGVGLGVGLGVPLLLMSAAVLFLFTRYQRLRANAGFPPDYSSTRQAAVKPLAQLDSKHVPPELATNEHSPHELQS